MDVVTTRTIRVIGPTTIDKTDIATTVAIDKETTAIIAQGMTVTVSVPLAIVVVQTLGHLSHIKPTDAPLVTHTSRTAEILFVAPTDLVALVSRTVIALITRVETADALTLRTGGKALGMRTGHSEKITETPETAEGRSHVTREIHKIYAGKHAQLRRVSTLPLKSNRLQTVPTIHHLKSSLKATTSDLSHVIAMSIVPLARQRDLFAAPAIAVILRLPTMVVTDTVDKKHKTRVGNQKNAMSRGYQTDVSSKGLVLRSAKTLVSGLRLQRKLTHC